MTQQTLPFPLSSTRVYITTEEDVQHGGNVDIFRQYVRYPSLLQTYRSYVVRVPEGATLSSPDYWAGMDPPYEWPG